MGIKINGIKRIGFKIIGNLKMIGLLILKILGISESCESFLICWFL